VRLSHPIRVRTPVEAYFSDGTERVRVLAVDGDRLILEDGPRRLVGPGESVNIVDPSLEILGTLTDTDRAYLDAMGEAGLKQVMLSYVESSADVEEVKALLPGAEIMLKIESRRGLNFVREGGARLGRLMAARGDLYIEVSRPHKLASALRRIVAADPEAVVASRLFDSLVAGPVPASADIGDASYLLELGYRTFMFGDLVCLRKETLLEALNLLQALAGEFA
jgi:pyruvate kinase